MTDKIEKLYELAKVGNIGYDAWDVKDLYPPFTAEKQLELIKLIGDNSKRNYYAYFTCDKDDIDNLYYLNFVKTEEKCDKNKTIKHAAFSQALAGLVCGLWEDLTPEQREEIRKVLE